MKIRTFPQQKAALTRAITRADVDALKAEVKRTVEEWQSPEWKAKYGTNAWPDDWARWQRALDDLIPWYDGVLIDNL